MHIRSRCFGGMYVERTMIVDVMVNMPSQFMISSHDQLHCACALCRNWQSTRSPVCSSVYIKLFFPNIKLFFEVSLKKLSCLNQYLMLLAAFIKVTKCLVIFHGEGNVH